MRLLTVRALFPAAIAGITVAAAGIALAAPSATTSAATDVTSTTATLNGRVAPDQSGTAAHFEYGTSAEYGSQTPSQDVNGNANKDVSAAVTGLAPSTTYHFRVVASSGGGVTPGADMTFTTPAQGAAANALTIAASPLTINFSRSTTITGQMSGSGNAGVELTLEENPYPYTAGFKATATKTTTTATGAYSMLAAPMLATHYRVATKGKDAVMSPEVAIRVRVKVTFHLGDSTPARGQKVRFYGTVLSGHDGKTVRIQRRTSTGGWRTVSTPVLVSAAPLNGTTRSSYSKRLRVNSTGTFRVRMSPGDVDHIAGTSSHRTATTH